MAVRKIVEIDAEKCDGCGLCATACAEGAIEIRDGKARLVSDVYCDGLGACLGECPRGAIRIVERQAEAFDEEAARRHAATAASPSTEACGCPGARSQTFVPLAMAAQADVASGDEGAASRLGHWPVQLRLVAPGAPFLRDADLLLVADCVPFAMADFHARLLRERPVVVACPKLDDAAAHVEKLAAILRESSVRSLTVVHMEVPCCSGLLRIAKQAQALAGRTVEARDVTISLRGQAIDSRRSGRA
ncbi:MAG: 4Fe-4S binding protein [Pirellulales bacterium]|nr:4Fe-4S binding protein [Pirellulales bacterium]